MRRTACISAASTGRSSPQAFGADAIVVQTEQQLANALSAALKSGNTTVIAARIDASGYVAQFNALREL